MRKTIRALSGRGAASAATGPDGVTEQRTAARPALLARRPSLRVTAVLATAMLAIGVGVGAAIGPAPTASFAGATPELIARLLSELAARNQAAGPPASTAPPADAAAEQAAVKAPQSNAAATPATPTSTTHAPAAQQPSAPTKTGAPASSNLPAATNVWLIELSGSSFEDLLAQSAAAPYLSGQLIPAGTLLGSWSAIQGSALASEAALLAPSSAASTPPIVHSIVQPPCPEGAAGESCSTPAGALTAADEFAKATLPQITSTPAYREHGLVVVTFASVGIASQQGLPAGASSATLTSQPPGGVVLLSPFSKAGRSSAAFNAKAPAKTLEKLLR